MIPATTEQRDPGRAALLASLQRTAILTSDKFKGVRLNLEPGTAARGQQQRRTGRGGGRTGHRLRWRRIEIGFNVTYLIDALANMEQDMVQIALADGNSSASITIPDNSHFKYVVMPMRI